MLDTSDASDACFMRELWLFLKLRIRDKLHRTDARTLPALVALLNGFNRDLAVVFLCPPQHFAEFVHKDLHRPHRTELTPTARRKDKTECAADERNHEAARDESTP